MSITDFLSDLINLYCLILLAEHWLPGDNMIHKDMSEA